MNLLKNKSLLFKIFIFLIIILLNYLLAKDKIVSWLVVSFVTYTVIFNNSVQTMGLFIASNRDKQLFFNILFFSSIFVVSLLLSWYLMNGEVHYGILNNISYYDKINIYFLLIPILLNIFTKNKIPVSATFLIIPIFATKNTIHTMINKTAVSYFLSFIISLIIYNFIYKKFGNLLDNKKKQTSFIWVLIQYFSTGILWFGWLFTSICNFVVFVPRVFEIKDIVLLSIIAIITIYSIFKNNGGEIQKIVEQKSDVNNIKTTVIFNSLFAFLLLFIQYISKIPITSTWMFLGILAGREMAITLNVPDISVIKYKICLLKIIKDLRYALIGIVFSLLFVYLFRYLFIN